MNAIPSSVKNLAKQYGSLVPAGTTNENERHAFMAFRSSRNWDIAYRYTNKLNTVSQLATEYGLHPNTIYGILRRRNVVVKGTNDSFVPPAKLLRRILPSTKNRGGPGIVRQLLKLSY